MSLALSLMPQLPLEQIEARHYRQFYKSKAKQTSEKINRHSIMSVNGLVKLSLNLEATQSRSSMQLA